MGRLSFAVILILIFFSTSSRADFRNVRQKIQDLRLQAHQLDLETRRLESSKLDLESSLKKIEEDMQQLNAEFYEVQRASIGRTSLQKGLSLFSAKSFSQFLKQKRWTKNWMVLQNQINLKFSVLKKNKSEKIKELEKIAMIQKEKQSELQKLETHILAEEKHRRLFVREVEGKYDTKGLKSAMASNLFLKPMQGRLVQKYGTSFVKPWDLSLQNWGWTFEADDGQAEVVAASDGVVQAIEELPYFGQVLILSHSGDFVTVYAGIHDILVQQGDHVSSSKVLAKAQRFYFELRHFTVPIDPSSWIRDSEMGPTATRSAAL